MDEESDKISRLEDRIEQLEATTKKMMPTRRDALKFGGAAAIGAAAMSGTASAGSSQVGTIGDSNNLVDVEAEDINVSDTLTTQDIVVNGTATGPFGGGGIVLESGDSVDVHVINQTLSAGSMTTLYSGSAKDVLGGSMLGDTHTNWYYEFSDNTVLNEAGFASKSFSFADQSSHKDGDGDFYEVAFLPPAKDVIEIGCGHKGLFNDHFLGAKVLLKS